MPAPWGDSPRRDYNLPFDNNCDATASYVFGMLLGGYPEPSFRDAETFFNAMFPQTSLSNDTVIEYHNYVWDPPFRLYNYADGLAPCRPQLCKLTSEHVDNAGIGVGTLISLGLEAILVLCYCIMAIVLFTRTVPEESRIPQVSRFTIFDRIVYAFYGTTRHFFICAVILCIGTSIGLIADAAHNIMAQGQAYARPYGHQLLTVAISYFSLAATVPAYLWGSRRQWLDAPLLVLTWVLSTTAIIINTLQSADSPQDNFSQICPDDFIPNGVLMACLFVAHGVGGWCPFLFALTTSCVLPFFKCGGRKMWAKPVIRRGMRSLILLYAVISFLVVWAFLLILYIFIAKTSWIRSNIFDMGQGIALALWVPLIYELVHSMIGKLPVLHVVRARPPTAMFT